MNTEGKPRIVSAIRLKGHSFPAGQESALAAVSTPQQILDWQRAGIIEGDWDDLPTETSELAPKIVTGADPKSIQGPLTGLGEGEAQPFLVERERSFEERAEDAATFLSSTYGIQRSPEETGTGFLARIAQERAEAAVRLEQRSSNITLERERRERAEQERDEAKTGLQIGEEQFKQLGELLTKAEQERDEARAEIEKLKVTPSTTAEGATPTTADATASDSATGETATEAKPARNKPARGE